MVYNVDNGNKFSKPWDFRMFVVKPMRTAAATTTKKTEEI